MDQGASASKEPYWQTLKRKKDEEWFQHIEVLTQSSTIPLTTLNREVDPKDYIYNRPIDLRGSLTPDFVKKNHHESPFRDYSKWHCLSRYLGFDLNVYLKYMKEEEDLAMGYYDHQFINFIRYSDYGHYRLDNTPPLEYTPAPRVELCEREYYFLEYVVTNCCFLVFAIILFQNVQNGREILEGTKANNNVDSERHIYFLDIYHGIIKDQTRTKLSMLRLENQIPWFAVDAVFKNSTLSKLFSIGIDKLAMSCFDDLYPRANKLKVHGGTFPSDGFKHLLHIFHWTRTPEGKWLVDTKPEEIVSAKRFSEFYIPNATILLGSATNFKRLDGGAIDVIYSNKLLSGQMEITPLHIFPYSRDLFRILLTFEQRYLECGLPLTAHLACMKSLLQTKEDVKHLQKNGIIQNTLKGEQDVLSLVHDMGDFLILELNACLPDDLSSLSEKVIEHHERSFSKAYFEFKNQFCPNRWVVFSIIVPFVLFVFTFLQTIYTALGYYRSP